jgi:hypothetical protein
MEHCSLDVLMMVVFCTIPIASPVALSGSVPDSPAAVSGGGGDDQQIDAKDIQFLEYDIDELEQRRVCTTIE